MVVASGTNLALMVSEEAGIRPGSITLAKACPVLKRLLSRYPFRGLLFWLGLLVIVNTPASARITENNSRLSRPDSRLHRPYEAPVFMTGHLGAGGAFQYDGVQLNYGGSFIFRPGSSANFFDFLSKLKSAMVLRLDYQGVEANGRLLSADLLLRRYLSTPAKDGTERLPFLGLGLGASDVNLPAAGGGNSRYWSYVAEVGQEWFFRPSFVLVARAQYRLFSYGDVFVSTWSVSGAVGIPVPW